MTATKRRTREELIALLRELAAVLDQEDAHMVADKMLLEYIDDEGIAEAYDAIAKWYA